MGVQVSSEHVKNLIFSLFHERKRINFKAAETLLLFVSFVVLTNTIAVFSFNIIPERKIHWNILLGSNPKQACAIRLFSLRLAFFSLLLSPFHSCHLFNLLSNDDRVSGGKEMVLMKNAASLFILAEEVTKMGHSRIFLGGSLLARYADFGQLEQSSR